MQTRDGGKKAAKTNKKRHGSSFYSDIGRLGGLVSRGGGFAKKTPCSCNVVYEDHFTAQCAGVKGGTKSRKTK